MAAEAAMAAGGVAEKAQRGGRRQALRQTCCEMFSVGSVTGRDRVLAESTHIHKDTSRPKLDRGSVSVG